MPTTCTFEGRILTVSTGRDSASGEVIATTKWALDELGLGSGTLVILGASEMRSGRSNEELRDLAAGLQDERLGAVGRRYRASLRNGACNSGARRGARGGPVFHYLEEAREWLHLMGRQETGQS